MDASCIVTNILPHIFIGDAASAVQLDVLIAHNITHIVNVTTEVDCVFPDSVQYCHIPLSSLSALWSRHF